jgi:S-adenosylmethionine:tRNA ribosyltransferase-isomerase
MAANTHLFSDLGASMDTRLLITPGYQFLWTDGLLTNFHLPRSTLLAMVAALLPGGISRLRSLYSTALEHGYRFFSYGDAMLILP